MSIKSKKTPFAVAFACNQVRTFLYRLYFGLGKANKNSSQIDEIVMKCEIIIKEIKCLIFFFRRIDCVRVRVCVCWL